MLSVPLVVVVASLRHPASDVWVHLWRTQLLELIGNTLLLVGAVGVGTLVLGTALAWLVTAYSFPGRTVFDWALVLPLALPAYVIGFAFLGIFDFAGPIQSAWRGWFGNARPLPDVRGGWGVALVMTLVFYPYVYLLARAAFREHGRVTLEAARILGRSRSRAFIEVVLPMARPSLVAGASLAMMEALADFGTVATFGYRTLTEAVFRVWAGMFDPVAATQLATLLLFLALGLLLLERAMRGRRRFTQSRRRGGVAVVPLGGVAALAATAFCSIVLGIAFVLPVGQLIVWAAGSGRLWPTRALLALVADTVTLAAAAAFAICALAILLAYAARLAPTTVVRVSAQMAAMGYALPGAVIAVGVLGPIAWTDRAVGAVVEAATGRPAGVWLTGSVAAILFAYAVRFFTVGFQTVEASLAAIPGSFDDAARALGVRLGGTLRRVHLPLVRSGILTAALLVWAETMKELPATLLLRPLGLKTLAVEVWERTSESMWAEAAVPALAIVAVGLVPLILATRIARTTWRS